MQGSEYCFWHEPNYPKSKTDIQMKIAEIRETKDVKVEGAVIFGEELEKTDFRGLKLVEAKFGREKPTNLRDANFSNTDLWRAKFRGSPSVQIDLSNAKFNNANLLETLFENARLDRADFTNAVLKSSTFRHASMEGVLLGDAQRLDNLVFDKVMWERDKINTYERNQKWGRAKRVYEALKEAYDKQGDKKQQLNFSTEKWNAGEKDQSFFLNG